MGCDLCFQITLEDSKEVRSKRKGGKGSWWIVWVALFSAIEEHKFRLVVGLVFSN